jgi:hypothetical protein
VLELAGPPSPEVPVPLQPQLLDLPA